MRRQYSAMVVPLGLVVMFDESLRSPISDRPQPRYGAVLGSRLRTPRSEMVTVSSPVGLIEAFTSTCPVRVQA